MKIQRLLILTSFELFFFLGCSLTDNPEKRNNQEKLLKTGIYLAGFLEKQIVVPSDFLCDTCIISTDNQSDTFSVRILNPSGSGQHIGKIKISKDTLILISVTKPDKTETEYKFNNKTNKIDTIKIISISQGYGPSHNMSFLTYKIVGLKEIPSFILYKDKVIYACSDKESFIVKENDTINYIDRFGLKQGIWIEYFKSGKPRSKSYFKNGFIQSTEEFNEKGEIILTNKSIYIDQ